MLALLEGSRRQESGDTAGAWDCYRAVLRMTAHVRRRESLERRWRVTSIALLSWLRKRLATWAADPRTTIPQLRRALEEVVEGRAKARVGFVCAQDRNIWIMRSLERPMHPFRSRADRGGVDLSPGRYAVAGRRESVISTQAQRFLLREPERSRRVVRLLCANWLAHVETPGQRKRPPAVRASR